MRKNPYQSKKDIWKIGEIEKMNPERFKFKLIADLENLYHKLSSTNNNKKQLQIESKIDYIEKMIKDFRKGKFNY